MILLDLLAVGILVFGIYFARHRRRDLLVAYLIVNIGVMAVAMLLSSSAVGAGLGLGLFGVLSIIRLRSSEIAQHEVGYYFAALALGLLAGLGVGGDWVAPALMALVVVTMLVGDSRVLFRRHRQQTITLDAAYADETQLRERLEELLGARVHVATVQRLDLVNDTTVVDVRYEIVRAPASATLAPTVQAPAYAAVAEEVLR
ncbi:uncharacterized protein DUF4956 [Homoserinimonas aerilata]|uniref:Uncharacterized protein DUF4956 n=2 Tax=Homoserinimonas aerilata TaxID=1162970 RepID=A0A542YGG3_9MICO|nr:uncharacterized protein DUF4956 [Homoserinimonas aerilata]